MKSLILLTLASASACCFAQDLQMGELHACSSSKPIGFVAVENCNVPPGVKSFYHMMTPDGHEYVFVRKWPTDHMMGRVYYWLDGDKVTVFEYVDPISGGTGKKLFTKTAIASQVLGKARE
jgi:hypothetical protein